MTTDIYHGDQRPMEALVESCRLSDYVRVSLEFAAVSISWLSIAVWRTPAVESTRLREVLPFFDGRMLQILTFSLMLCILLMLYILELKLLKKKPTKFHLEFRPGANGGIWCCCLIPLVILASCQIFSQQQSTACNLLCVQGMFLFSASLLLLYRLIISNIQHLALEKCSVVVLVMLATLGASYITGTGLVTSLFVSTTAQISFCWTLSVLPVMCPRSFTIGEALVFSQAVALFTSFALLDIGVGILGIQFVTGSTKATKFAEVALLGCEIASLIWLSVPSLRSTLGFYSTCAGVAIFFIFPCIQAVLQQNIFSWLFSYLSSNYTRMALFASWILVTTAAILFVVQQQQQSSTSTYQRKVFHGLLLFIFVPGLLHDMELLCFCTMIALGLFIITECVRLLRIPPLGAALNKELKKFLDEKDQGKLILTHIYLLVGCSFPLWLHPTLPEKSRPATIVFCGILSAGIGDATASLVGTNFGAHPFPGTKKTLEGTIASIITQLGACALFLSTESFQIQFVTIMPFMVIIVICSFLEAFTLQIDNIIIPLYMYTIWLLL